MTFTEDTVASGGVVDTSYYAGSHLLLPLTKTIGLPVDQINFGGKSSSVNFTCLSNINFTYHQCHLPINFTYLSFSLCCNFKTNIFLPFSPSLSHSRAVACRAISLFSASLHHSRVPPPLVRVGRRFRHGGFLLRQNRRSTRHFVVFQFCHFIHRDGRRSRNCLQNSPQRFRLFYDLSLLQSYLSPNLRLRKLYTGRHGPHDAFGFESNG